MIDISESVMQFLLAFTVAGPLIGAAAALLPAPPGLKGKSPDQAVLRHGVTVTGVILLATIVLALGGVATTDGGAGMLQSLGAVLAEEDGTPIGPGGAKFVLRPEDLSVVVASNLNADILSDLGSALAGSLGLAASANLNPERRFPSMFEPVHGSAPDIAGQGLANPIGAVGSAALMLEHFGLPDQAARLNKAIEATTGAGILTRDVGGTATTDDVVKALIDALEA